MFSCKLLAFLLPFVATPQDAEPKGTLKVFLLAGQSNMEGQAVVDLDHADHYNGGRGNLEHVLREPEMKARFGHLRDENGNWTKRDDVLISYRTGHGELKAGELSIGYAVYPGRNHFGPELELGRVLGDLFDEPVLLVKTAWGGKSLGHDFRPPSAGGQVGPFYEKMLAEYRETLASLAERFPRVAELEPELAGFVWFQGWNDMVDDVLTAEYEDNLVHLVRDVRRDLGVPDLPVVVAETGNCDDMELRGAQKSAAGRPEIAGRCAFVPTALFRRPADESPNRGHGHHWFGNAASYLQIGEAMGLALKSLLRAEDPSAFANPRLLVTTDWLAKHGADEGVVVVDARGANDHAAGHVPGAVSLPTSATYDPAARGNLGPPEQIAAVLGERGIARTTHVVIYDAGRSTTAARLFWTLEVYGHAKVSVVDGGLAKWSAEGRALSRSPTDVEAVEYAIDARVSHLSTLEQVRDDVENAAVVMLDARSAREFESGRIPQAVHIDWTRNFTTDEAPVLRPASELLALYRDQGVTRDKRVHAY